MPTFTTTPSSFPAGTIITDTKLANWELLLGAISGPWTAFVPGLTNVTLGNGTLAAEYLQAGELIMVKISLTFGSTTAFTGAPRFALPVSAADSLVVFPCILYDNSTPATRNPGICTLNANTLVPYGPNGDVDATHPFTWAVSDVFRATGLYEAA